MVKVQVCKEANGEHRGSCRQYAHTFHKDGIVCVAKAYYELPESVKLAIMLHEVGHLIAGPNGGESDANEAVWEVTRIKIYYIDTPHGEQLEWIKPRDKERAREFLGEYVKGW